MASLKEARALADELRAQAETIVAALDGNVDFGRLVSLADELGQASDRFAVTFHTIDTAFASRAGATALAAAEEREVPEEEVAVAAVPSRPRRRRRQTGKRPTAEATEPAEEQAEQTEQESEASAARATS